jgi:hypothetical protein
VVGHRWPMRLLYFFMTTIASFRLSNESGGTAAKVTERLGLESTSM